MSDYGDDDEQYEFEYSDQEDEMQEDDVTVSVENKYYGSKGHLGSDNQAAMAGFREVLELEASKHDGSLAEWGFKATKQIVKLAFRMNQNGVMLQTYKDLLSKINSGAVTRNKAEKSINSILDLVSNGNDSEHLSNFYNTTLQALSGPGNERLAFKTKTKLARLYLQAQDWKKLRSLISELLAACGPVAAGAGTSAATALALASPSDAGSGTQLLEVYALQIQMYTEMRDNKRLSEIYHKALGIKSAVPHPGILGIIKECGGKMHMRERGWEAARLDFQESFKAYEEAGQTSKTLSCLRYLLLASMLSDSRFNPFDDQSTKAYERDPAVTAMTQLTDAYLSNDITSFESVLNKHSSELRGDEFLRGYIDDLLTSIRTQVALQLTVPYTRVSISHIAGELSVSSQEAESLLVSLILDGKLAATIDQPNQILVVTGSVGDRSQATPTTTGTTATGKANPSGANLLASASASSSSAASSSSSAAGASKSASSGISGGGSGGGFAAKYLELAGLANRVGRLVSTLTAAPVSQIGLAHFD